MSSLQLPGLSTGIDTKALIDQLMAVEGRRLATYTTNVTKFEEKKTAVTELQSKLFTYKSSLEDLADASQLRSFQASSNDESALTVSANSQAYEGSHTVQVKQLATADRWVHDGFKYATSYVGEGTFLFSYDHQQMTIQTTADTTLEDLAALINNDSENPGVTASVLKYDDGADGVFHLVLSGRNSGSDYQITVDTSSAEVHTAASTLQADGENAGDTTKISELDDFSGQSIDFADVTQVTISGNQHDGTPVNTVFVINEHSTLEDLIGEIETAYGDTVKVTFEDGQFKIIDKTVGASSMTLNLDFETATQTASLTFNQSTVGGAVTADIASLAAATFSETQSAQDSLFKVDDYPPGADDWISRSTNTVDDVIAGVTLSLHGNTEDLDNPGTYESVEINLTRNTEQLKEKMNAMIEAYNTVIMYVDEKTTYDEETNTAGILSSEYTLTSIRSLLRTPLLTNAVGFTASDSFLNPRDIGLSVGADGMLELDENAFDEAVVDDYLGVLSLMGAQKTGSTSGVDSAYVKYYGASRYTTAGAFDVQVTVDGGGVITSALIKQADEEWADARSATIDGNYIYGNDELDSSYKPVHPEFDLQLAVDTSQTGRTMEVTVNIRQGFAGNLYEQVDDLLKSGSGRVPISIESIEDQVSLMERRIEDEERRLERVEERMIEKYARLEKMLSMIQQQFAGIAML
ncbi:MAG: flagellar filament capping protein FliD [Planctomycetota bacterium]|jgi:flagellar hook-associated protein 2